MIMDSQLLICESMSIAAAAGAHVHGTNIVRIPQVVDHKGVAMKDRPNVSSRLYFNVVVEDEDMVAAVDGAVVTFYLYNGATGTNPLIDNAGVPILSKAVTANTTSAQPDGTLICSMPLPVEQLEEYFDIYVTVATQNLDTGKITAWIGGPVQQGT